MSTTGSIQQHRQYPPSKKYKTLNLRKLLDDRGVEYTEGNNGWLNMPCIICYKGDGVNGLGWSGTVFSCFRCGRLPRWETLAGLLGVDVQNARRIASGYEGDGDMPSRSSNAPQGRLRRSTKLKMPYGLGPLQSRHREYLQQRGFDPSKLAKEWDLRATGPLGKYSHRIVIPIHYDGDVVCWQARDITGKAKAKYLTCPDEDAIYTVKETLYGLDYCVGDTVVITEGPTKVWRLGPGAVATFGTAVTVHQLLLLKRFKRRIVLFDDDDAGCEGADILAAHLSSLFGGTNEIMFCQDTPDIGDISDSRAKKLMEQLLQK